MPNALCSTDQQTLEQAIQDWKRLNGILSWKPGKPVFPQFPPSFHLKDGAAVPVILLSPLDRLRMGRRERTRQFGFQVSKEDSFEFNQSFPRAQKPFVFDGIQMTPNVKTYTMDKFQGDALNTFSFSPGHTRGSFAKIPKSASCNRSISESWSFYNMINSSTPGGSSYTPVNIHNPNKAVVTINGKTSEILIANDMACRLFGYSSNELCTKRLCDLFKHKRSQEALVETHLQMNGELVLVSGKVVDIVNSEGDVVPVSLWMTKLEKSQEARCLAVMEPVERTSAVVTFDSNGTILQCDKTMAILHGYTSPSELEGLNLQSLIPSFILPKDNDPKCLPKHIRKQRATGRTKDGASFPLSILVEPAPDTKNNQQPVNLNCSLTSTELLLQKLDINKASPENFSLICEPALSDANPSLSPNSTSESTSDLGSTAGCSNASTPEDPIISGNIYVGFVWVFANISGMITIFPDGTIHSCNHYFSLMLLGYPQKQLVGKNISFLIPTFYDDLEFLVSEPVSVPSFEDIAHLNSETDMGKGEVELELQRDNKKSMEEKIFPEILRKIENFSSTLEDDTWIKQTIQSALYKQNEKPKKMECVKDLTKCFSDSEKLKNDGKEKNSNIENLVGKLRSILEGAENFLSSDDKRSKRDTIAYTELEPDESGLQMPDQNGNPPVLQEPQMWDKDVSTSPNTDVKLCFTLEEDGETEEPEDRKKLSLLDDLILQIEQEELMEEQLNLRSDSRSLAGKKFHFRHKSFSYDNIYCLSTKPLRRALSVPRKVLFHEKTELVMKSRKKRRSSGFGSHSKSFHNLPRKPLEENLHLSDTDKLTPPNRYLGISSNCTSAYSSQGTMTDEEMSSGSGSSKTATNLEKERNEEAEEKCSDPIADPDEFAFTSTPVNKSKRANLKPLNLSDRKDLPAIVEGSYFGLGRHLDGSDLGIIYQIKRIDLIDGQILYCLWVSRDPEEPAEGGRTFRSLTLASSINSTLEASASAASLGQMINDKAHQADRSLSIRTQDNMDANDHSLDATTDADYLAGSYSELYSTLQQIGKGAFGCVKMAYRNNDNLLVITKFIRKAKVYDDCWVFDPVLYKLAPLEVSLLMTLNHPNIVQVLDVFENDVCFQMVMEKHGCGMDLFEFIDRQPRLDEPLASYIFRQVFSAVNYLHSHRILHRDIKDENIILDEHFQIMLIDFGSATFMSPDVEFSTFCGTVEYCSPEVLQGNKYKGPELEMWSLGVTLYTLIFGENPFFDIEETIKAILRPPFRTSEELMKLINGLLHPDPTRRYTLTDVDASPWLHLSVKIENYKFDEVIHCTNEEANPPKYYDEIESSEITFDSHKSTTTNESSDAEDIVNESHGEQDEMEIEKVLVKENDEVC